MAVYRRIYARDNPRADVNGQVALSLLVVERALGHCLPSAAVIHHVDNNPESNVHGNLVACQDHAYHMLLHRRLRAYLACGNASALRCYLCKSYERQEDIRVYGRNIVHKDCINSATLKRYHAKYGSR